MPAAPVKQVGSPGLKWRVYGIERYNLLIFTTDPKSAPSHAQQLDKEGTLQPNSNCAETMRKAIEEVCIVHLQGKEDTRLI